MTLSWGTPTDGIGTRTTAHLNFTRTMAEDRYFLSARRIETSTEPDLEDGEDYS